MFPKVLENVLQKIENREMLGHVQLKLHVFWGTGTRVVEMICFFGTRAREVEMIWVLMNWGTCS